MSEDFLYKESRALFQAPEITAADDVKLEWKVPDEEKLIEFLCTEKGFSVERVQAGIARIHKARGKSSQKRMESFFGTVASPGSIAAGNKRKAEALKKKKSLKGNPNNPDDSFKHSGLLTSLP